MTLQIDPFPRGPNGREVIIEAAIEHQDGMLHRAEVQGFTFYSDEPERLGGNNAHPYPLSYLSAAAGFCLMTQTVHFAKRLKVDLKNVRVKVRIGFDREGSTLAGTVRAVCTRVETDIEIESDSDPASVASLIQIAKNGCFVEAALTQPMEIETAVTLNGSPFDYLAFPAKPPERVS